MSEIDQFKQLKQALAICFAKRQPEAVLPPIEAWKGKEIRAFQADLQDAVGGYLSEKWFYTHIKEPDNRKLPRVDMLNMLAQYVGYENWLDYQQAQAPSGAKSLIDMPLAKSKLIRLLIGGGTLIILLITIFVLRFFFSGWTSEIVYTANFCFLDKDSESPIDTELKVYLLQNGQSPMLLKNDAQSCVDLEQEKASLRLVVSAAYYKKDTIERELRTAMHQEKIYLEKDDYALMLHYFSTQRLEDWQRRKKQLESMIADDAELVQLMEIEGKDAGIELYNKEEFIQKMTMPINSLKDIKILDTRYKNGQIVHIRFIQEGL